MGRRSQRGANAQTVLDEQTYYRNKIVDLETEIKFLRAEVANLEGHIRQIHTDHVEQIRILLDAHRLEVERLTNGARQG